MTPRRWSQVGRSFPILTALSIATAARVEGQVRVEIAPSAGAYLPNSDVINVGPACSAGIPGINFACGKPTTVVAQETAPLLGGRVTFRTRGRIGADVSLGYAASRLTSGTFVSSGALLDTTGPVIAGSFRVLYDLAASSSRTAFFVAAGVGFLVHETDYSASLNGYPVAMQGRTDWGPVLGLGARMGLTRTLALRGDLEQYFYTRGPSADIAHLRGDFVVSLGLSMTVAP